jgi:lipoprotein-anchoring transpeptidase ErfK/SrfK
MAAGQISPDVGIGGQIGIHGVPAGQDYLIYDRSNWTLGCVALATEDINELYQMVQRGTRVVIVP